MLGSSEVLALVPVVHDMLDLRWPGHVDGHIGSEVGLHSKVLIRVLFVFAQEVLCTAKLLRLITSSWHLFDPRD